VIFEGVATRGQSGLKLNTSPSPVVGLDQRCNADGIDQLCVNTHRTGGAPDTPLENRLTSACAQSCRYRCPCPEGNDECGAATCSSLIGPALVEQLSSAVGEILLLFVTAMFTNGSTHRVRR